MTYAAEQYSTAGQPVSSSAPAGQVQPATVLLGVVFLGIAGFGLQAGPVYTPPSGSLSWPGIAGLALLLAGLLAVPGRSHDARHYRITVAVLSAFGLLVALMGLIDRPTQAGVGWALVVMTICAAVQAMLAGFALIDRQPRAPGPATVAADNAAPSSPEPTTRSAISEPYEWDRGTTLAGAQAGAPGVAHAVTPSPEERSFTPPPSPAATGAQPSGGPSVHLPAAAWGEHARARPIQDRAAQPTRNEWPM